MRLAAISPPSIAMASVLFLVLGDMSAAIIGVSFGQETCTVKLGRGGKKSIEGSVAMFIVCFLVGSTTFANVHLREYPVFFGALAATLTAMIGFEAFFNFAVVMGMVPPKGLVLPFISYGSSAMLANLWAVGVLLSIAAEGNEQALKEGWPLRGVFSRSGRQTVASTVPGA